MGIITKEVEVKPSGKMIQYYKDKGYDAKCLKPLMVKVEDLPKYSHIQIEVQCEICSEIHKVKYKDYNKITKNGNYYCCSNCSKIKRIETNLERYGFKNVMQNKEIYNKQSNSLKNNYGVSTPLKNKDILQRMEETMNCKYGFGCSAFSPLIKEKIVQSFYQNSSQKASIQQRYICNLYHAILNFPVKYYNVDMYLKENDLVIEYDGGFHMGNVITGRETKEEFEHKEIIRNNVIKREGYKQMRIISSTDLLPSDEILLQMLEYAKQYFSNYSNHSWIEFNIDSSTVRNAEQKEGSYFNYGDLRRIKKSA